VSDVSKFESGSFRGGYDDFAINAEKYSEQEAIKIFEEETGNTVGELPGRYKISKAWVRHRAGINEDGEPQVCWWLEYGQHKRSCPVYAFHRICKRKAEGR
jgi:hypothetical protein